MHFISSFLYPILSYWNVICIVISLFLHVLDDLWDFHTKSLFLAFNIWEAEYPPFLVFIVSGVSRTQIIKGKIPRQFFIRRRVEERRPKAGGPRGPNGVVPRGPCTWPRGTHQLDPRAPPRVGLFTDTFVFAEKGRPNFPRII